MGYDDWVESRGQKMKYLSDYNTTTASKLLFSPEYTKAMIVRDPKDRLLSIFFDRIKEDNNNLKAACCQYNTRCVKEATSFQGFVKLIQKCRHPYWRPQAHQMEPRYYRILDFVGNFENSLDAQRLLERIHALDFGKSGWGTTGNQTIFEMFDHEYQRVHKLLPQYYNAGVEIEVDRVVYDSDYANEKLNLTRNAIHPFM